MRKKITFLLLISLLSTSLFSCGIENDDYNNYSFITKDEIYTKFAKTYGVYVYSLSCTHCQSIKQDVLKLFKKYKNSEDIQYYLCNAPLLFSDYSTVKSSPDLTYEQQVIECRSFSLNSTSLETTYIIGTPTLYLFSINEGETTHHISDQITGYQQIKNYVYENI